LTSDLNYKAPAGIPDKSEFGGSVPDGLFESKIIGWRLNEAKPNNAWVEFENLEYPEEGKFSMNVFLPTQQALNQKASELAASKGLKGEELKERTMKSFFHWGQTMKIAGVDKGLSIKESLDKLVGWTGKAVYETPAGFSTRVKKIMSAKEAKQATAPVSQIQAF
jgi:hypothetical protein